MPPPKEGCAGGSRRSNGELDIVVGDIDWRREAAGLPSSAAAARSSTRLELLGGEEVNGFLRSQLAG
jgi:hypothetical protein